ncbi:MAG: YggS family pyridoxal phosphate-dependent enzyme [Nitrospira sp.]
MTEQETQEAVARRVQAVVDGMRRAAERAGRHANSVRLVAATKTVPAERIRDGIAAGLRILGENRMQEALAKIALLQDAAVEWHFIGQLQRRKVRDAIGRFTLIHSVDSIELAEEIDRRAAAAGVTQAVLLELNIGGEASKAGFVPEGLMTRLESLNRLAHLRIRGLMAIPPPTEDAEQARPYFRRLRELRDAIEAKGMASVEMSELSMGMSHDYEVAIEEGATLVRVGTAIFGARHV